MFTQDNQSFHCEILPARVKNDGIEGRKDNSIENHRQRILEEKQFLNLLSTLLKTHHHFYCRNSERKRKERCEAATGMEPAVYTTDLDTKDSVYYML